MTWRNRQAVHRIRPTFHGDRHDEIGDDGVSHQPIGGFAEQDLTRGRVLLEPGGHVDRVSGNESLIGLGLTCDDLAGVDADARRDGHSPGGADLLVEVVQGGGHLLRRSDGPQRVVLVQLRHAENRHHRVADELLHRSAVPLHRPAHLVEVQRHHPAYGLGIKPLPECGGLDNIAEHAR